MLLLTIRERWRSRGVHEEMTSAHISDVPKHLDWATAPRPMNTREDSINSLRPAPLLVKCALLPPAQTFQRFRVLYKDMMRVSDPVFSCFQITFDEARGPIVSISISLIVVSIWSGVQLLTLISSPMFDSTSFRVLKTRSIGGLYRYQSI